LPHGIFVIEEVSVSLAFSSNSTWSSQIVGYRPQEARRFNRATVLEVLRQAPQGRAELARILGLSKPSLGDVVGGLLEDGVVSELAPTPTSRGRYPARLAISPERFCVLGIDLSPHASWVNLYDASGQCLERQNYGALGKTVTEIEQVLIEVCRQAQKCSPFPLAAIGIAAPGPVNVKSGMVLSPRNFAAIHGFSVFKLEQALGVAVRLEHDSAAAATQYLAQTGHEHFVYVLLTEGIGAGIVIGRRVYRGQNGFAAEFGRLLPQVGASHSLEQMAGPEAIKHLYHATTGKFLDLETIARQARQGETSAKQVFASAGQHLGWSISLLQNLLDPGFLVLGGPGAYYADCFLASLESFLSSENHTYSIQIDSTPDPIAAGAAKVVLSQIDLGEIPLPSIKKEVVLG
jgi:predicted NBD/HSP70 family sugar kinase